MKNNLSGRLRSSACACALALGLVSAMADYSSTLSGLNPIGYWRFNEPAQPAVPTYLMSNTGTAGATANGLYYGVPTLGQPGALGIETAANFSGNLQYAETTNSAALNPTGPFSVEFWANVTNDTAGAKSGVVSRYITVPGGPTGQFGYLFFLNNGNTTWQFRVYNGASATTITDANIVDVAADNWYHVVGVYDGANIQIYVNGLPTSSTTGTVVYAPNTNAPTRIGAGTPETAPSLYFPGLLDNVAVYHRVLTPEQITAHYDAATTNAVGYNAQILADSPAVYYPLNEAPVPPYVPYAATNSGTLGSAQNGTYTLVGATTGVAGPRSPQFAGFATNNNAVTLNGTSGEIIIPPFNTVTDTVTFTGWIKRTGSQGNSSPILFQRAAGSPASGLVVDFTDRLSYVWNDDPATYSFNPGADMYIPEGVWTFAAVSINPNDATLYLGTTNGLKSVTRTGAHAAHDFSFGPLQIGRDGTSTTRLIRGGLDEVALFDQALDATTISNLFYSATPAIPLVTRVPAADPLYEGMNVTFTAYGVAAGPVNYQWRKGGSPLGGQNTSKLELPNLSPASSGDYDVVVTYGANSATSAVYTINVQAGPPVVLANPTAVTRYAGLSAMFTASAGGSVPLNYQWQKNSNDIVGATSPTLTLTDITEDDAASYRAKLVNPYGTNYTTGATLTVLPAPSDFAGSVVSFGPIAYWRLNETSGTTAYDYAGDFNGTTVGGAPVGADGPRPATGQAGFETSNTAFTFNGTSQWVEAPALKFNTNTVTFSAWIKLAAYHPTDLAGIVFARGTEGAAGLHMVSSGELRYHWTGGEHYGFASGLVPPLNQWVFVALVIEPTRATFYMNDGNGLVSSVNNTAHNVVAGNDPMFIGRDRTDRVFNGEIDEAAVFKRALLPEEIQSLSLIGVSGPTAPEIASQPRSQAVIVGAPVSFTVRAIGGAPISYQWKLDGVNIPGETSSTLEIPVAYYSNAGVYTVGVTNSLGGILSTGATLAVSPIPEFANLTNDLVLHLKFDGDTQDSSGRANHGTAVGAPVFTTGKLGGALTYSTDVTGGSYNYVTLGNPTDLQFEAPGTTDFTVAYWVKFTGTPGDLPFLGSGANSYGSFGLTFAPSYTEGGWSYWAGGISASVGLYGPAASINDDQWHSLVHTFDRDGDAVTYLDGEIVDTRSMSAVDYVDSGLGFNVGQDPTGGYGESGSATIDDIGIWRRALTPVEAQAIYTVGESGTSFDTHGPVTVTLQKDGTTLEIIWQAGTLESSDDVDGPWATVNDAAAPYYTTTPATGAKFYRVKL